MVSANPCLLWYSVGLANQGDNMANPTDAETVNTAMITADPVVLGVLMVVLGLIFLSENSPHTFWKKFYTFVPALLLCYFIPGLLNTFGVINGEASKLYPRKSVV